MNASASGAVPLIAILTHIATFGDRGRKVGSFLATYLDTGAHDRQGDEMETHILAKDWAAMVQAEEAEALRALSRLMEDIYLSKHKAHHLLRHVAWQHPITLGSLIHGLPPDDQTFILHALDGDWSKPGVQKFYEDFIASTPYPHLVKAARRYAGMLDESAE
ncbi:MAG: hypothetical protein H0T46_22325 [Deltaproteobacteria bacterium]|nr:hypothetical protein [Deltaproteobacteria bacterium]